MNDTITPQMAEAHLKTDAEAVKAALEKDKAKIEEHFQPKEVVGDEPRPL